MTVMRGLIYVYIMKWCASDLYKSVVVKLSLGLLDFKGNAKHLTPWCVWICVFVCVGRTKGFVCDQCVWLCAHYSHGGSIWHWHLFRFNKIEFHVPPLLITKFCFCCVL